MAEALTGSGEPGALPPLVLYSCSCSKAAGKADVWVCPPEPCSSVGIAWSPTGVDRLGNCPKTIMKLHHRAVTVGKCLAVCCIRVEALQAESEYQDPPSKP